VGAHRITAAYGGDVNFGPSAGATSQTVLSKVTLASLANPALHGQVVSLSAGVSPAPASGSITFKDSGTILATVALNNGHAVYSTSALAIGRHSLIAIYSGGGVSNVVSQVVNKANTTVTMAQSVNPSVHGQTVTFTAGAHAVAPGAGIPAGVVTFRDGATVLGSVPLNASGVASLSTAALTVGSHSITASYLGSTFFNPGAGTEVHTVN
jgi:hypothetical protein